MTLGRCVLLALTSMLMTTAPRCVAASQDDTSFPGFLESEAFVKGSPGKDSYVVKWARNVAINLYFTSETPLGLLENVTEAASDAQQASGLPVSYSSHNYDVFFVFSNWKKKELEGRVDLVLPFFKNRDEALRFISLNENSKNTCGYKILVDAAGRIQGGIMLADVGAPDLQDLKYCTTRAVAALFGMGVLTNDEVTSYPSITNSKLKSTSLTDYDKRLLKLIYSPTISA